MNTGSNHTKNSSNTAKKKKRGGSHAKQRKIRYDRIAVVTALFVLMIVLITACSHGCRKTDDGTDKPGTTTTAEESSDNPAQTATSTPVATDTTTTSADPHDITLDEGGVKTGNLIVVNADHEYLFPADDLDLHNVYEEHNEFYSVSDMTVQLDVETLDQLNAMMQAFSQETGLSDLRVISGYRNQEDQEEKYESGSSTFPGGYSDYHTGRSFDIGIYPEGTGSDYYNAEKYPDYSWISEHAAEYGFVVRFPEGSDDLTGVSSRTYTFRYVGVPHATYMTQNSICLEKYTELIQDYTESDPLEIKVGDVTYSVFYVPVTDEDSVKVSIPSGSYTLSGDNIGGYIIACQSSL